MSPIARIGASRGLPAFSRPGANAWLEVTTAFDPRRTCIALGPLFVSSRLMAPHVPSVAKNFWDMVVSLEKAGYRAGNNLYGATATKQSRHSCPQCLSARYADRTKRCRAFLTGVPYDWRLLPTEVAAAAAAVVAVVAVAAGGSDGRGGSGRSG